MKFEKEIRIRYAWGICFIACMINTLIYFLLISFLPIVTVSLKDQYFIPNKSRYGEIWLEFCRFINISYTILSSIYRKIDKYKLYVKQ